MAPFWLCWPFCCKAEATDEKAAETDESIVLSTMLARFPFFQRWITTCYFLAIMPFIVFAEILSAFFTPGFHVNRDHRTHDRIVDGMLYKGYIVSGDAPFENLENKNCQKFANSNYYYSQIHFQWGGWSMLYFSICSLKGEFLIEFGAQAWWLRRRSVFSTGFLSPCWMGCNKSLYRHRSQRCLKICHLDWQRSLCRHSRFPDNQSLNDFVPWLFLEHHRKFLICGFEWNISTITGWITIKCCHMCSLVAEM